MIGLVSGGDFGMPLHRDEKGMIGQFDGFYRAVGGSGGDAQPPPEAVNGLVVSGGARGRVRADDICEAGIGLDVNAVPRGIARWHPMSHAQPHPVGQVRHQRAAEGDVEDLQTAADAQSG